MTSPIHFAHGNGFPSASYQLLLNQLSEHRRVCQIPLLGHDPKYPVGNNWSHLTEQLIHSIERQAQQPVIAIGHSLGGALTLLAALQRPELFRAIILLDVPTFNRFESFLVQVAKVTGLINRLSPAHKVKTRRTEWASMAQATDYFRSRRLFSRLHEQCLQDYLACGLTENRQGGVALVYQLAVELAVYRTLPHKMVLQPGMLTVPAGVLVGHQSDTVRKNQYLRMENHLGFTSMRVPGSHMFPLEYPLETAAHIGTLLERMGVQQ
ncbi:alpha/beta hydrolase [Reinekea sp.]|jgi:pimeloyl-ACP methyl ester carboxylesterase|uniref:alpha/beta fold hydrolase n=1 Tax=Reinekea sp. TaxID=1970455 RepID=UPI002A83A1F0|nr:alpha/beta hydrolase [Reinekea sp.]